MKARSTMKHRTTIERCSKVPDTGGGYTDSWTSQATNVPCRGWTINAQEIVASDRPGIVNTRLVIMPRWTDIRTGDRLVSITDRKGVVLHDGPLIVDGISEKVDHVQLTTRKIT